MIKPKIDACLHADLTGGSPLKCGVCGGEQTIEQTERDSLMYGWGLGTAECDGCKESREGWAQECAYDAWEDSQR